MSTYSVYIHTNKINGKRYIGVTTMIPEKRWANGEGYKNQYFYRAIQKYGWDNFDNFILEVDSAELMYKLEKQYIDYYQTTNPDKGYNISIGGDMGGYQGKNSGTKEYIKKYCESHKQEKSLYDKQYRMENIWKRKEKDKRWRMNHKKPREITPIAPLW